MAYFYHNKETGEAGIGGKPSKEEVAAGEAKEDDCDSFEKLYGDD